MNYLTKDCNCKLDDIARAKDCNCKLDDIARAKCSGDAQLREKKH